MRVDEAIFHPFSLAKKAVAFFKMSRSKAKRSPPVPLADLLLFLERLVLAFQFIESVL